MDYTLTICNELLEWKSNGLDLATVKEYYEQGYSTKQIRQIRKGLLSGVDVSVYATMKNNYKQMKEIRLALEDGLDPSPYCNIGLPSYMLREYRLIHKAGFNPLDYTKYFSKVLDAECVRMVLLAGLDPANVFISENIVDPVSTLKAIVEVINK